MNKENHPNAAFAAFENVPIDSSHTKASDLNKDGKLISSHSNRLNIGDTPKMEEPQSSNNNNNLNTNGQGLISPSRFNNHEGVENQPIQQEIEGEEGTGIAVDIEDQNPNQPSLEEEIRKSTSILQSCVAILTNFWFLGLIFLVYFGLGLGNEVLFVLFTTFQILSVMINLVRQKREDKRFFLIERMHIFFVTALIYLKLELNAFKLIYCMVSIPIVHIFYWLKNSKEKHAIISANFACRTLIFLQLLQIALRVDGLIQWDWNLVFWIFWMVAIMSVFYVMGLSILLVLTLYYKYFGQAENFQIIGLVWCFSNISNFVVGLCLILKGVMNYMQKSKDFGLLQQGLIVTEIWILLNFAYSLVLKNQIIKFINVLLYDRDIVETEQDINQIEPGKRQKVIYNVETVDKLPDDMPHFLMKFSSTYFQNSEITKDILAKLMGGKGRSKRPKRSRPPKQSLKKFEKKSCENDPETLSLDKPQDLQPGKSGGSGKKSSESEKNVAEKDGVGKNNESNIQEKSVLNESEINQSVLNQSHNVTLNQSLNQSVASCLICYEKPPDAVLMECGHGGLCYDCALDIWKKNGECYLCRKEIVKIYQIDVRGGTGQYKPILKFSNLKKEVIEESIAENETEEQQPPGQSSQLEGNNESHDESSSNNEIDNRILHYLEQQN